MPGLATALLAFVVFAQRFTAPISQFDGGISSSAATFTLHGLLPYRDYWLLYGPLSGYLLAIPTALFGPSVELTRLCGLIVIAGQAAISYAIASRWAPRMASLLIAITASSFVPILVGLELSAWSLAMLFTLAGLWVLGWTRASAVIGGCLIGLAFLSRLDVGAYALVAALAFRDRKMVLAAFLAVAAPFAALTLLTTPVGDIVEQLFWYPLVGPRLFRSLPDIGSGVAPEVALLLTLPLVLLPRTMILASSIRIAVRPIDRAIVGLAVLAALCQLQTLGRADVPHFALAATPALLLLAPLVRHQSPQSVALLAASVTASLAIPVAVLASGAFAMPPERDAAFAQAIRVTKLVTAPTEPIFVGLTRTRYAFENSLIAYYLADRAPGTTQTMFNPGVTNTVATETRIVAELLQTQTKVLLLDEAQSEVFEPQNASRIPGPSILDDFIAANYGTMCMFGDYRVMSRLVLDRTVPPCPDPKGRP
jgi:hypothetical protein